MPDNSCNRRVLSRYAIDSARGELNSAAEGGIEVALHAPEETVGNMRCNGDETSECFSSRKEPQLEEECSHTVPETTDVRGLFLQQLLGHWHQQPFSAPS